MFQTVSRLLPEIPLILVTSRLLSEFPLILVTTRIDAAPAEIRTQLFCTHISPASTTADARQIAA